MILLICAIWFLVSMLTTFIYCKRSSDPIVRSLTGFNTLWTPYHLVRLRNPVTYERISLSGLIKRMEDHTDFFEDLSDRVDDKVCQPIAVIVTKVFRYLAELVINIPNVVICMAVSWTSLPFAITYFILKGDTNVVEVPEASGQADTATS